MGAIYETFKYIFHYNFAIDYYFSDSEYKKKLEESEKRVQNNKQQSTKSIVDRVSKDLFFYKFSYDYFDRVCLDSEQDLNEFGIKRIDGIRVIYDQNKFKKHIQNRINKLIKNNFRGNAVHIIKNKSQTISNQVSTQLIKKFGFENLEKIKLEHYPENKSQIKKEKQKEKQIISKSITTKSKTQIELEKTLELDKKYGYKINKILPTKQLKSHYEILDKRMYEILDSYQSKLNKNKITLQDKLDAKIYLDEFVNSLGNDKFSILNPLKEIIDFKIENSSQISSNQSTNLEEIIQDENSNIKLENLKLESTKQVFEEILKHYDNIYIPNKVQKSIDQNKFQKPKILFQALQTLFETNFSTDRKNIEKHIQENTEFKYSNRNSHIWFLRKKSETKDYFVEYKKKQYELHKHIKYGSNTTEEKMIRIAFEYLPKENKFLIGFVGEHQKTKR